jgi:pyruvate formate lyase activating enzyme
MTGLVSSIERYALEDGPGIRTLVFLKGCPLRCEWCANPESQLYQPEVLYYSNKCASCGRCIELCPQQAISLDETFGLLTDRDTCIICGLCAENCYYAARTISGETMTVAEVMDVVERDRLFYEKSGGGVTLSGGEPLVQASFVAELTHRCQEQGIHSAIESSLCANWETVKKTLEYVNLVFVDIKHIDSSRHKQRTGVGNERILENIKMLDGLRKPFIIRVPFIPGFNDDTETQKKIFAWALPLKHLLWLEVLPYHRLALGKYRGLGRDYKLKDVKPVKKRELGYLVEIGAEIGVDVRIGAT